MSTRSHIDLPNLRKLVKDFKGQNPHRVVTVLEIAPLLDALVSELESQLGTIASTQRRIDNPPRY